MGALSNFLENRLVDGLKRGGCLTTAGAAGPSTVVKGIRANTTAYVLGDIVVPQSGDTGAGGKLLLCTTAGTTASAALAVPNPGSTVADGTVTWTAIATVPAFLNTYFGIAVCTKGILARLTAYALNDTVVVSAADGVYHLYKVTTAGTTASGAPSYPGVIGEVITDGTAVLTEQSNAMDDGTAVVEPSGGSYARVTYAATLANWAGTQSAGSTTASTGTNATTSNNNAITFPAPTAAWANGSQMAWGIVEFDLAGNVVTWAPLSAPKTINNGDPAPSVAAGSQTLQFDS